MLFIIDDQTHRTTCPSLQRLHRIKSAMLAQEHGCLKSWTINMKRFNSLSYLYLHRYSFVHACIYPFIHLVSGAPIASQAPWTEKPTNHKCGPRSNKNKIKNQLLLWRRVLKVCDKCQFEVSGSDAPRKWQSSWDEQSFQAEGAVLPKSYSRRHGERGIVRGLRGRREHDHTAGVGHS